MVFRPADALELAFLQDAQQLDSGSTAAAPRTSSRKSVPLSASSKRPLRSAVAPVNAPLLVAEQLALDDRLGQGAAVRLDERPVGAIAVVVDRVSHQLLARAGLAGDEDGGLALGDLGDLVVDELHLVRIADDVAGAENGPRSSARRRWFSSSRRSRSSCAARRSLTAWAISEATIVSKRTSSLRSRSGVVVAVRAERAGDLVCRP